jgi:electron-transferring-flavoprotein dehydrogenase
MTVERESIEFDVLFVGGGPASLAGAIRLMQRAEGEGLSPEVAVIEKGAEFGAHALSGAVMNPGPLADLIPDYKDRDYPLEARVRGDAFYHLTRTGRQRIPYIPPAMHNTGFHVVSLSRLTRWLAEIAEEMGINLFPGFAGKEILYASDQRTVAGVRTDDKGLDKSGAPRSNFEPGIDLMAKVTVFGEGARGNLTRSLTDRLRIDDGRKPPVYETGLKEVIALPRGRGLSTDPVNVIHTLGYPLGLDIPGGGFIYEMGDHRVALGLLVGLSYDDPSLDIYEELLKFKDHPLVAGIIRGGRVVESGARIVSTGGQYTMPSLAVDGAMIIGGAAELQNVPGLKGIHLAIRSGMLAADAIIDGLSASDFTARTLGRYPERLAAAPEWGEIVAGRNFSAALDRKGLAKWIHLGLQQISGGRGLHDPMRTWPNVRKMSPLVRDRERERLDRKRLDGELYLDRLTSVYRSKTQHREDQPPHLVIHDPELCVTRCYPRYGCPCTRFCPGGVYELETETADGTPRLRLNPSNCLHCKTCDVVDPFNNITWTPPEGGDGPNYTVV